MPGRFDAVMDALQAGVVIHSADTTILDANARARALLGILDLEGRLATDPAWVFLEADRTPMTLERFPVMQVLASRAPLRDFRIIIRPPDGSELTLTVSATPEFDDDGAIREVAVTFIDTTERDRYEQTLLAGARQLAETERIAHVGHWTLDLRTGEVMWSPALYAMFGMDPESAPPDYAHQAQLFAPESWARLTALIDRALETGEPYALDAEIIRADGTTGWIEARGEPERDHTGEIVRMRGISLDISERIRASQELASLATRDVLTQLANRASLMDDLARHLIRAGRDETEVAVLLLDLDHFKDVNDTFGHAAGDELLVAAAERLDAVVRGGDLVARLGGDEFVVVMPDVRDRDEPQRVAARIVESFRRAFVLRIGEVFATASVGLAFGGAGVEGGDLLREADTAMYAAKTAGRDRIGRFDERLRAAASTRLGVEADLRRAVERQELAVWYQPEVDLLTGAVVGLEALLRWHHPSGAVWNADRFVSVAEESGLILEIGPWVLAEACRHAAEWARDQGRSRSAVRVNVSAMQLAEAGLLDDLDRAVSACGLDPTLLCLEITETALLHHTATVAANLEGIHARAISIAIDDFGTGYASLSNLHLYPIDLIKIDRSFIGDPGSAQQDHRLLAGIIALARTLGLAITAEGVEEASQARELVRMGCTSAQGWHFSRAVPPEEIPAILHRTFAVPGQVSLRTG